MISFRDVKPVLITIHISREFLTFANHTQTPHPSSISKFSARLISKKDALPHALILVVLNIYKGKAPMK